MDAQKLFGLIDELYPRYVEFWKDICMIETPTREKQRVDTLGGFLKEKAEALGFRIQEHREELAGNALCFTMNADAPGAPVCFSAHMDTVHPVGAFGQPPVHMDEAFIYGPGVTDCKGGIAAGFLAMHALQSAGFTARPVKLILQSDEELSSRFSQKRTVAFMTEMARGSAAFLNLEMHAAMKMGQGDETDSEPAVLTRKGILRYQFSIFGKAAHSARCQDGVSAVAEAAFKIIELEKMKSDRGLTCNCSMLRGGSAANVVPETCSFTADIRFRTKEDLLQAQKTVQRIAETAFVPGSRCELEQVSFRCAMEREARNEALLERMNEIYARVGLPLLHAAASAGGSDAADISSAGIPTVDSIGVSGSGIHALQERAELSSLAACAKRVAVIAAELP